MLSHRRLWYARILACATLLFLPLVVHAQAFQGYTLFSPNNSRNTYLVNMSNTVVKSWTHNKNGGYSCYLLEDGSVIRPALSSNSSLGGGGEAGVVQKMSWSGTLTWEYTYSSSTYRTHHDICPLPNGNVLAIAWEVKTAAQAVQAGLNHSSTIWPDHIIEIQPVGSTGGNIVWQWHAWDHLIQDYNASKDNYGVVADHPELLDINVESSGSGDWLHINGISYNPILDQIVMSSHELDEIYVIDHSTTTAEAATHTGGRSGRGGDILYRWGRPANYRAPGTQVFNVVHCATWVPPGLPGAGDIMAFNNREGQTTSIVVELVPPSDSLGHYTLVPGSAYGPASPTWSYTASGFYSNHLGGCQRLPNGNTLIVESTSGYMFEVNAAGTTEWSYNRGGEIVRALRYAPAYPGLAGLGLAVFSVSPLSVSFGDVAVASSKSDSVTIRNTGTGSLSITAMALNNTADFSLTETAPRSVAAGDSLRLHLMFHPQSAGLRTGRIVLTHSTSTSPDTILLEGNGIDAVCTIDPQAILFGSLSITETRTDSFAIRNSGAGTLSITSATLDDLTNFSVAEAGPFNIIAGDSVVVHVTFHPASNGTHTGHVIFHHNGGSSPDSATLTGDGMAPAFTANPGSLAFGAVHVGLTAIDSVYVSNVGSLSMTINSITLTDPAVFAVAESAPIVLAPGAGVQMHVSFHPVVAAVSLASLMVESTAPGSPHTIGLSGTGSMTVSIDVSLTSGWNMVSNPLTTAADSVGSVFTTSLYPYAFGFEPATGYVQAPVLDAGSGYWAKFGEPGVTSITGSVRLSDTVDVDAGWNMVGSISTPVDTASVVWIPAGLRASDWFGYGPAGLTPATQIVPGKAYWVKASGPGKCILSSSTFALPAQPSASDRRHESR
jgi:hypothetical protein